MVTTFEIAKTVQRTQAQFGAVQGPWSALAGVAVQGYEIHHGQTAQHPAMAAKGDVAREVIPGMCWQNAQGNVLGLYLHGLLEDPAALQALFGREGAAPCPRWTPCLTAWPPWPRRTLPRASCKASLRSPTDPRIR